MNFVTYNNIRLKCYLNFVFMAPCVKVGSPIVARAIDKFRSSINELKKIEYVFSLAYFRSQNLGVLRLIVGLKISSA